MKTKKFAARAPSIVFLFYFGLMLSLPSCAKQTSKMEAQSSTWKVTVLSVKKMAKQPDKDRRNYPSPRSQSDLLEVVFTAELLGTGGKIAVPKAVLIDGQGQKHQSVQSSRDLPESITQMPEGNDKRDAISRFLACMSPELEGKEPCLLTIGEKLSLTSSFVDPKDRNLKFSFADVPQIILKVPYDQKGTE
jgi:hypothetical protein